MCQYWTPVVVPTGLSPHKNSTRNSKTITINVNVLLFIPTNLQPALSFKINISGTSVGRLEFVRSSTLYETTFNTFRPKSTSLGHLYAVVRLYGMIDSIEEGSSVLYWSVSGSGSREKRSLEQAPFGLHVIMLFTRERSQTLRNTARVT